MITYFQNIVDLQFFPCFHATKIAFCDGLLYGETKLAKWKTFCVQKNTAMKWIQNSNGTNLVFHDKRPGRHKLKIFDFSQIQRIKIKSNKYEFYAKIHTTY